MKKTALRSLLLLLLLSLTLNSCGGKEGDGYRFDYPEEYTPAYFHQNYVECDPNLIHLRAAENSAGRHEENGRYTTYHAIQDVPVEAYVCFREDFIILDPGFESYIARSREVEVSAPEILSWTVEKAELYWRNGHHFSDAPEEKMGTIGEDICYETLAEVDGAGFQAHLKACVETEGYRVNGAGCMWNTVTKRFIHSEGGTKAESDLMLTLRVHFKEYENIVWDGKVVTIEGGEDAYYVLFHLFTTTENVPEGFYRDVFVPLPAGIVQQIAQQIAQ